MELEGFSALKTFSIPCLRICRAVIAGGVTPVLASGTKHTRSPYLTTGKSNGYFYVRDELCAIPHRCNFKNKSKQISELQNIIFFSSPKLQFLMLHLPFIP